MLQPLSASWELPIMRKNSFNIPRGKAGKTFTNELARLFLAFASGSVLESVALKAAIVLPILTLQNQAVDPNQKIIMPVWKDV